MRKSILALMLVIPASLIAGPAAAAPADSFTNVIHDVVSTTTFSADVCGPRANTTTVTIKTEQVHVTTRPNGGFQFHTVDVTSFVTDYLDPALPTLTGESTNVNNFNVTNGGTVVATSTFHSSFGDIRIFHRFHVTLVNGQPVVTREVSKVTGCI
jgi:hypothetical protein